MHFLETSRVSLVLTGERPPTDPSTARRYAEMGLPWFDYYRGDAEAIEAAEKFKTVAGVPQIRAKKAETRLPDTETIDVAHTLRLGDRGARPVREGTFAEATTEK